ncbi:MAG: Uma2 family endonuclease [Chloroflexi bacterium]|nr:Uma2 family endonuclease [Chloroflexota bacterium]MCY3638011.1 Uma2 family endonuclease [Chloroflexota bacterium]
MTTLLTKRRFSVKEFIKMVDAGILTKYDRVELVDGEIVEMAPIGGYHAGCVDELTHTFVRTAPEGVRVRVQGPLQVDSLTEFEPDLAVLRPRHDNYTTSRPTPPDILLVIEVSDSTIAYDRNVKIPKYAQAGVPEVWQVNLQHDLVDSYSDPDTDTGRYPQCAPFPARAGNNANSAAQCHAQC